MTTVQTPQYAVDQKIVLWKGKKKVWRITAVNPYEREVFYDLADDNPDRPRTRTAREIDIFGLAPEPESAAEPAGETAPES